MDRWSLHIAEISLLNRKIEPRSHHGHGTAGRIRPDQRDPGYSQVGAGRVEFIDENGGGPGVRLRKRQRAKQSK